MPSAEKKSLEIGAHASLDPEAPHLQQALNAEIEPDYADNGYDLVYELSGNPDALNQAIAVAGIEARIVVGSWYGIKKAEMALGTGFHRNRIRLISSQVSSLASEFSGRWSKQRRLNAAWDMIKKLKPADFITHRFDVHQADEAYELLDKRPQEAIQVILTYNQ